MKPIFLIFIIISLTACNKSNNNVQNQEDEREYKITVLERGSQLPIEGAKVSLQECSKYDNQFGCISYSTVKSFTTNAMGEVSYKGLSKVEAMELDHPNYFRGFENQRQGTVDLSPNAWMRLRFKMGGTYNSSDYINVNVYRKTVMFFPFYSQQWNVVPDKSIFIKVPGVEGVSMSYEIRRPTTAGYQVLTQGRLNDTALGRFDTANLTFTY